MENEDLKTVPEKDTEIKKFLVEYTGNKLQPDDNEVTVEMIVSAMAEEFPEFLMAVAEENFIRGYEQAFVDVESANSVLSKK
tara:strand:+ start:62 stop:307 length:246 start_codon:yes stop_codon:yes gene_type:complete